jgi:hypothetical protein
VQKATDELQPLVPSLAVTADPAEPESKRLALAEKWRFRNWCLKLPIQYFFMGDKSYEAKDFPVGSINLATNSLQCSTVSNDLTWIHFFRSSGILNESSSPDCSISRPWR